MRHRSRLRQKQHKYKQNGIFVSFSSPMLAPISL
jgi:hypothetical protein